MTQLLALANPATGIWQSADCRLTTTHGGYGGTTVKMVTLQCSDASAVVTYAGVGAWHGVAVSDWVCGVLRGETRSLSDNVELILHSVANNSHLFEKNPHLFLIASVGANGSSFVQVRNFTDTESGLSVAPEFSTIKTSITSSGSALVFPHRKRVLDRLRPLSSVHPRDPADFHGLLAAMNRDISRSTTSVSPECTTSHIPPTGQPIRIVSHDGWPTARAPRRLRRSLAARQRPTLDALRLVPGVVLGFDLGPSMRSRVRKLLGLEPLRSELESLPARGEIITSVDHFQARARRPLRKQPRQP